MNFPMIGAICFSLLLSIVGSYNIGRSDGADIVRKAWHAERLEIQNRSAKALADAVAENAAILAKQQENSRKVSDDYEAKIAALNDQYRAARPAGRLRIAVSACRQNASAANSPAAGGAHEAAVLDDVFAEVRERSIDLTEQALYDLAHDADEQAIQLKALQDWIKSWQ